MLANFTLQGKVNSFWNEELCSGFFVRIENVECSSGPSIQRAHWNNTCWTSEWRFHLLLCSFHVSFHQFLPVFFWFALLKWLQKQKSNWLLFSALVKQWLFCGQFISQCPPQKSRCISWFKGYSFRPCDRANSWSTVLFQSDCAWPKWKCVRLFLFFDAQEILRSTEFRSNLFIFGPRAWQSQSIHICGWRHNSNGIQRPSCNCRHAQGQSQSVAKQMWKTPHNAADLCCLTFWLLLLDGH